MEDDPPLARLRVPSVPAMNPRIDGQEKALFFRGKHRRSRVKTAAQQQALLVRERENPKSTRNGGGGGGEWECGAETIVARSRPFEKASGAGNLRVREMHASVAAAAVRY